MLESYRIVFLSYKLWFLIKTSFLYVGMHIFFLLCIHLKCYTPSDVHLIRCALREKKWLKELMHQKRNEVLFSLMFFLCFLFWLFYFFICVLIIWLSFMHHIIIIQHMFYDLNPFISLQTCFKWHGYSSFKRKEKKLNI
jgi:hypothetical protein